MLSLFSCVGRRTINSLSSISFSCRTQSQNKCHSTYYYNYDNNKDNKDHDFDQNNANDSKSDSNSNSKTFSQCKYNLLTSRLLETVGWLGAAIVVGLNFESRFYIGSKLSKRRQIRELELSSNCGRKLRWICGDCKYCNRFMSKLLAFATPGIKNTSFVLDSINNGLIGNNNRNDNNLRDDKDSNQTQFKCIENNESEVSRRINKQLAESNDPIDEICQQLERASIDYIEQLNNMLGIALIQTDPEEAMQCWSNSKNNSKALFNMGVAFESGKHSTDGKSDLMRAFQHYELSASMGHKMAIYNLSLFYLYGKGHIQVDLNKANALLERAAQLGVEQAKQFCNQLNLKNRLKHQTQIQTQTQTKTQKFSKRPIIKTSASAPNLSVMSHSQPLYDSVNYENSKHKFKYNDSIANWV